MRCTYIATGSNVTASFLLRVRPSDLIDFFLRALAVTQWKCAARSLRVVMSISLHGGWGGREGGKEGRKERGGQSGSQSSPLRETSERAARATALLLLPAGRRRGNCADRARERNEGGQTDAGRSVGAAHAAAASERGSRNLVGKKGRPTDRPTDR